MFKSSHYLNYLKHLFMNISIVQFLNKIRFWQVITKDFHPYRFSFLKKVVIWMKSVNHHQFSIQHQEKGKYRRKKKRKMIF